jgi:hypothetical protein
MNGRDDDYLKLLFCPEDQTLSKLNPPPGVSAFYVIQFEHNFSHGYNSMGLEGRLSQVQNTSETIMLGDSSRASSTVGTAYRHLLPIDSGFARIDHTQNMGKLYPRHSRGMSTVFSCVDGRVLTLRAGAPYDSSRLYLEPQSGGIGGASKPIGNWWDKETF